MKRIVGLDDLFAVIVEHLAFTGEAEFFLAPLDEQRFELPLQGTDLLADRRLGDLLICAALVKLSVSAKSQNTFKTFDLHKLINMLRLMSQLMFS